MQVQVLFRTFHKHAARYFVPRFTINKLKIQFSFYSIFWIHSEILTLHTVGCAHVSLQHPNLVWDNIVRWCKGMHHGGDRSLTWKEIGHV
jgi:hypothetical protein